MSYGVQPNLNDELNHGGSEFLNCKYTSQDGHSLTCEFDKQLHGDARLANEICVVLRNYDCNRPILTIIRTVHSPTL